MQPVGTAQFFRPPVSADSTAGQRRAYGLASGVVAILPIGHVVPDTEAEGPGRRFAIWVQGCPLRCPDCCNPELLDFAGGTERTTEELAEEIFATEGIEGVSFLGGEPFSHAAGVLDLARRVRQRGLSVMIFSGFTLAELHARKRPEIAEILAITDLLVDGRYDRALPDTQRRWIGSRNQVMHFLSDRYSPTDPQFHGKNTVEIRLGKDGLMVNGWPSAAAALTAALQPSATGIADSEPAGASESTSES